MFRVNPAKRFLRQSDGSWHLPVICEGRDGAQASVIVRLVTPLNPADGNFWQEANRLCRDLRSQGFVLGRGMDGWRLLRPVADPVAP